MSAVRTEGELTEWFGIKEGVRQGCGLSPDLFNLILEIVMRLAEKAGSDTGVKLNGRLVDNLRFADDIDLLADLKESLQDLTNSVDKSSKRMGLKINAEKTKTMAIGKQHRNCKCNWEQRCWNRTQDLSFWED